MIIAPHRLPRLLLAALLFVGVPFLQGTGQGEDPDFVKCTKCRNVGAKPCPEHKAHDCELEDNVLFCSRMAGCETCGGTGWVDCPHCENEKIEKRLEAKRRAMPWHLDAATKIDEQMERRVHQVATKHFVIVCELGPQKVNKKKLNEHEVIHLYADRLEQLYSDYCRILKVQDSEFAQKCMIMIWGSEIEHRKAASRFCGSSAPTGIKLLGATPRYSTPGIKRYHKNDESLHRNVVHNTVHLLMSHQQPSQWIGQIKGGWADAGLAHWFEDYYWKKCDNYCYEEVDTSRGFKGGNWRPAIRKMVTLDKAPTFGELLLQNTTTLTREQHAVSFSLIDFLIHTDAEALNNVLRRLRRKEASRDALKKEFGLTVLELETKWKEWVLATYPAR